ncbi:MAG: DUF4296 domain-containing protein [Cyclobacteriaceae bacterium]|nr:DUF4296 domain-containing protein [Cyclobacteriaceae bacterium]
MRCLATGMIFLLSLLLSCKTDDLPEGVLSKPEMVNWMIKIYLAEARTTLLPIGRDSAYKLFVPAQDSLKKLAGVQDSVLKKSYQYYLENPKELESIYDAVIDSLSLREQRLRQTPAQPVTNP